MKTQYTPGKADFDTISKTDTITNFFMSYKKWTDKVNDKYYFTPVSSIRPLPEGGPF